jgi:hypothetical protein
MSVQTHMTSEPTTKRQLKNLKSGSVMLPPDLDVTVSITFQVHRHGVPTDRAGGPMRTVRVFLRWIFNILWVKRERGQASEAFSLISDAALFRDPNHFNPNRLG